MKEREKDRESGGRETERSRERLVEGSAIAPERERERERELLFTKA